MHASDRREVAALQNASFLYRVNEIHLEKLLSMTRFRWRRAVLADRLQDGYRSIAVFLLPSHSIAVL